MSTKKRVFFACIFFLAVLTLAVLAGGILAYAKTPPVNAKVTFTYEDKKYAYTQSPKTSSYLSEVELNKRGYYLPEKEKADLLKSIRKIGFSKEEAVRYVYFGIEKTIEKIEKEINREPVDSVVTFNSDKSPHFSFSAEKNGCRVARTTLYETLYARFLSGGAVSVAVPVEILKPEHTAASWKERTVERASFTTGYAGSSEARKHNVALALKFYNGLTVAPGQAVSFNKLVGARTEVRGFEKAKIILDGAYEDGVGGGVCQSSTTLYNALILAGLKVTKRSPHSLTSSYISPGFDAMVNSGTADLEFINNTDFPIYIKTAATDTGVTVKIFGEKPKYKIVRRKIVTETVEPPPDKIIFDFEGKHADRVYYVDEWHQAQPSKQGLTAEAYLEYYEKGKLVKTEKIHTDRYKPVQGVYVYGTHFRPTAPPPPPQPEQLPQYFYPQN